MSQKGNKMQNLQIPTKYFSNIGGYNFLNSDGAAYFYKIVKEELHYLYENDSVLFNVKASEDTLKFAFALRIVARINDDTRFDNNFATYYIDQNYNRLSCSPKYVINPNSIPRTNGKKPSRNLFDLVIHARGNGAIEYPENLIHFEFKGLGWISKKSIEKDYSRLRATARYKNNFEISRFGYSHEGEHDFVCGYQLGIFVKFVNDNEGGKVTAFENGKEICLINFIYKPQR